MALNLNDVQEAIISELKGDTTLTTALGGDTEIREDMWPSPDWNYPRIPVQKQFGRIKVQPKKQKEKFSHS